MLVFYFDIFVLIFESNIVNDYCEFEFFVVFSSLFINVVEQDSCVFIVVENSIFIDLEEDEIDDEEGNGCIVVYVVDCVVDDDVLLLLIEEI